jgi:hypothetical protein
MKLRYKLFLVVGILVTTWLFGRCQRPLRSGGTSTSGPNKTVTAVLPSNVKERIAFNEKTHTLTVQTATKTTTEYARNPDIQILKNGEVKVDRHLSGFENEPFLGGGYADTGRLFLGDNVFHFGRLDLMGAVGWTPDNRYSAIKAYAGINYLVYSNTSVGLGLNPITLAEQKIEIAGFISVRL